MSSTSPRPTLVNLVDGIEKEIDAVLLEDTQAQVSQEAAQRLFAAAVKLYVAMRTEDEEMLPVSASVVTATDVATTASAMLKAVNLEVFELGIWNTWRGG